MSINEFSSTSTGGPNQDFFFNSILTGNLLGVDHKFSIESEDIRDNGSFNLDKLTTTETFNKHLHTNENKNFDYNLFEQNLLLVDGMMSE